MPVGDANYDENVRSLQSETVFSYELNSTSLDLSALHGDVSSSDHLIALHAVPLPTPLHGLVPEEWIPKDGDADFEDLAAAFTEPITSIFANEHTSAFANVWEQLAELPLRKRGLFHSVDDGNFAGDLSNAHNLEFEDDQDPDDDNPRAQWTLFSVIFGRYLRRLKLDSIWDFKYVVSLLIQALVTFY